MTILQEKGWTAVEYFKRRTGHACESCSPRDCWWKAISTRATIQSAELQRDPLRHALKALAPHLKALHRVLADATLTIGAQLDEAKRPSAADDLQRLGKVAADGAWRATAGLVQAHIWRTILICSATIRMVAALPRLRCSPGLTGCLI